MGPRHVNAKSPQSGSAEPKEMANSTVIWSFRNILNLFCYNCFGSHFGCFQSFWRCFVLFCIYMRSSAPVVVLCLLVFVYVLVTILGLFVVVMCLFIVIFRHFALVVHRLNGLTGNVNTYVPLLPIHFWPYRPPQEEHACSTRKSSIDPVVTSLGTLHFARSYFRLHNVLCHCNRNCN